MINIIYIYPAIFTPALVHNRGTVYTVEIPDIPGCITEGDSIADAIFMAREALAGCILAMKRAKEDIPSASNYRDIEKLVTADDFITLVDVNLNYYMPRKITKPDIKTVSARRYGRIRRNKLFSSLAERVRT